MFSLALGYLLAGDIALAEKARARQEVLLKGRTHKQITTG